MSGDEEVSSICKRSVVSTRPVKPGKFCPLTVLDRVMEHNFIRIVFYYRNFIDRVKQNETIAEMLDAYTIVTGRLLRSPGQQWMVRCNDAGLRVIEAKVKGTVDQWLQNVDRDKELKLAHLEPIFSEPYFWSAFYIQINEFEGGGVAIGLSCTHLLADPTTATSLIKAWANISFTGKMLTPPHFHPLPPRRPADESSYYHHNHINSDRVIDNYKKSTTQKQQQSQMISPNNPTTTISLLFDDETVTMCMSMAQTPSVFDALAGVFWTLISKVRNVGGFMEVSVGLDVRKILGLDKGFYGNCMVYNKVKRDQNIVLDNNANDLIRQASNAIRKAIKEMDKGGIIDLIEWLDKNNCEANNVLDGCDSLVCVNLEGLDSYSACFGGKFDPVHVSYYIEPDSEPGYKLLVLPAPPSPETGLLSRIVMVTLPENEAAKLMEDKLIKQLSPCIKMGIKKKLN